MSELILFTTAGCHLCETAEQLLRAQRRSTPSLAWRAVDIADDDELFARYGWSIPVLQREDGTELNWPFDAAGLAAFLSADAPAKRR